MACALFLSCQDPYTLVIICVNRHIRRNTGQVSVVDIIMKGSAFMGVQPLERSDLPQHEALFSMTEGILGYLPNSMLTMSKSPELLYSFSMLTATVLKEKPKASKFTMLKMGIKQLIGIAKMQRVKPAIEPDLKWLVAYVTSRSAGCQYCQAHTVFSASKSGVSDEKLQAAFEFENQRPLYR